MVTEEQWNRVLVVLMLLSVPIYPVAGLIWLAAIIVTMIKATMEGKRNRWRGP